MIAEPARILIGALAPGFHAPTGTHPRFRFDSMAGRYVALSFLGSAAPRVAQDYRAFSFPFDDERAAAFVVAGDPADIAQGRLADQPRGLRIFHDFTGEIARLYGRVRTGGELSPGTYLLDPLLRVLEFLPLEDPACHGAEVAARIAAQPEIPGAGMTAMAGPAPILVVPGVFEPSFCRLLIDVYERHGGRPSGFMEERDGRSELVQDDQFKRRSDHMLTDRAVIEAASLRIEHRLVPMVEKAFRYKVSRMERYLVACYDSAEGGFFLPHRDNTTRATRHRAFAVSLHLNSDSYEGGELRFPEFGRQTYRAPTGAAIVFSCSLLHEATPVTAGKRYMFLPFLYDEEGALLRQQNDEIARQKNDEILRREAES